jgi:hypothetical protein
MITDRTKDFVTHLNYINTLVALSNELKVTLEPLVKKVQEDELIKKHKDKLETKQKLLELMKKSLEYDHERISIHKEYALVSCVWMPIKLRTRSW